MMLGIWWLVIKPPWRVHYPLTRLEPQRIQGPERRRKSKRNRIAGNPEVFIGVISMAGGCIPEIDAPAPAAGYEVDLQVVSGTGFTFHRRTSTELRKALRFVLGK